MRREVADRLGSDTDSRRIVERASGYSGVELAAHLRELAPGRAVELVEAMVGRRRRGEPLQYVVGIWGFRRLELLVDARVLIPRPETEVVVQVALAELNRLEAQPHEDSKRPSVVVDLGTGSGAIALSVALEAPRSQVWATDASVAALAVARANLAGMGSYVAPRVRLVEGDWFDALPAGLAGRVDLVVSNPPYVGAAEVLPAEVANWEPQRALIAGPTGLEALAQLIEAAPGWLSRPGSLVCELAPHQAAEAAALARSQGYPVVSVHPDLTGRSRVLLARL